MYCDEFIKGKCHPKIKIQSSAHHFVSEELEQIESTKTASIKLLLLRLVNDAVESDLNVMAYERLDGSMGQIRRHFMLFVFGFMCSIYSNCIRFPAMLFTFNSNCFVDSNTPPTPQLTVVNKH